MSGAIPTVDTRRRARLVSALCASVAIASPCVALGVLSPVPAGAASATTAVHDACSAPNSAHVPCHFSTPSGNIRCLWTPKPDNVACELVATGRAYRLRPTGHARAVTLKLARRGQTLPTSQEIVFPQSLSCTDTRTTITCNQDFGLGEFKLAMKGSHGS